MAIVLFLIAVTFVVYRATTPEERGRMLDAARAAAQRAFRKYGQRSPADQEFDEALRARKSRAWITLALLLVNLTAFVVTMPGRGGADGREALVSWGASFGPRTTDGEWWRLVTALAVESGVLAFVVHTASLLVVGPLVERLLGARALLATYLTAGVLAGVWNLSVQPVGVSSGGAAAILGLYGLIAGCWARGALQPVALAVPVRTLQRLVPMGLLLVMQSALSRELGMSSLIVGFSAGVAAGLVLMDPVVTTSSRRSAYLLASGWAMAIVLAISVQTITDIRPLLARVATLETRTFANYEAARQRFQTGKAATASLVDVIEGAILPELRAEQLEVDGLEHVPREHEGMVRDVADYLRHRTKSWELRAAGLKAMSGAPRRTTGAADKTPLPQPGTRAQDQARHSANMMTMGRAETEEREALATLGRLVAGSRPPQG